MKEQTWNLLEHALSRIVYTRDPLPEGPGYPPRFRLRREDESNFAVLYVYTYNPNTYRPDEMRLTRHEFIVPVATYHEDAWIRWVFDRIVSIELHETCETFQVDGVRVYAPHHGNGEDPYVFWPGGTAEQKAKAPGDD